VSLEIVSNHNGHPSTLFGPSGGRPHLLAEHIGGASGSEPASEPAITPVDQTKAIDLAIIPRRLDQALPTSTLATPDARQHRVKGHLHLILQIQVCVWKKGEQGSQVGWQLTPQISCDQVIDG